MSDASECLARHLPWWIPSAITEWYSKRRIWYTTRHCKHTADFARHAGDRHTNTDLRARVNQEHAFGWPKGSQPLLNTTVFS